MTRTLISSLEKYSAMHSFFKSIIYPIDSEHFFETLVININKFGEIPV